MNVYSQAFNILRRSQRCLYTLIIIHNTQIQTPAESFALEPGSCEEMALPKTCGWEILEFSIWLCPCLQYTSSQDFIHSRLL